MKQIKAQNEKYEWGSVDWQKTAKQICAELGCSKAAVYYARKKYAPKSIKNRRTLDWEAVDFQQTTTKIMKALKVAWITVNDARKKYAPKTLGLLQGYPLDEIDWSQTDGQIARLIGKDKMTVKRAREKLARDATQKKALIIYRKSEPASAPNMEVIMRNHRARIYG